MARTDRSTKAEVAEESNQSHGECFVIMPISDPEGYSDGHFRRVYEDIFKPAIIKAGYEPKRADDVLETNLIQLDLLRRLLEAPMALCDLSSRNPNVLFELGIRQAFDKPVALVQEEDTPRIFDITPLRATPYRRNRIYHEVLADQNAIADAITATHRAAEDPKNVNSLVRLLGFTEPATIKEVKNAERDPAVQLVRAELAELRRELRMRDRIPKESTSGRVDDNISPVKIPFVSGMYLGLRTGDSLTKRLVGELMAFLKVPISVRDVANPITAGFPTYIEFGNAVSYPSLFGSFVGISERLGQAPPPPYKFVFVDRPENF